MYEMYPEWGPARNRHEDETDTAPHRRPRYWERELVGAGAPASRDGDADRPDDN